MKKFLALALCLVGGVCALTAQQTSKITGNITDLPAGSKLSLWAPAEDGSMKGVEQKTVDDGTFVFEVPVENFTEYVLSMKSKLLSVWLEPGKDAAIIGNGDNIHLWDVESDVQRQKEFNMFHDLEKEFRQKEYVTENAIEELMEQGAANSEMADLLRLQVRNLNADMEAAERVMATAQIELIEHIPANDEVVYRLLWFSRYIRMSRQPYADFKDEVVALYEALPEEYKNSDSGKETYFNLYGPPQLKVGDGVPDVEAFDLDGKAVKLTDFKGKYVLLDIWGVGCGPCIAAFPEMKEIAEEYADRLVVVSLSIDPKEVWEKASKEHGITWVSLNDFKADQGLVAYFYSGSMPAYTVIDPEGVVAKQWKGYAPGDLKRQVGEVLDK